MNQQQLACRRLTDGIRDRWGGDVSSYSTACNALTPDEFIDAEQYYTPCAQGCLSQNTSMDPANMDGYIFYCMDQCGVDALSKATGMPLPPINNEGFAYEKGSKEWNCPKIIFLILLLGLLAWAVYYAINKRK